MQLLTFKIVVFLMVLIIVEIGVVGAILNALLNTLLGVRVPAWVGEFVDQLTYAALMTLIYFAVVGATWMVCRRTFPQLLATGNAEILAAIKAMGESPAQREKRECKERAQAGSNHAGENERPEPAGDPADPEDGTP